jgi:hypothetical protein
LPHQGPQKATRWKARIYLRGQDGVRQEIVRFGRTRREAETSLDAAVATVLRGADAVIRPYAVDNGVLSSDATRQVRTVTSIAAKSKERDHTPAMTRTERDHILEATLVAAREPD